MSLSLNGMVHQPVGAVLYWRCPNGIIRCILGTKQATTWRFFIYLIQQIKLKLAVVVAESF